MKRRKSFLGKIADFVLGEPIPTENQAIAREGVRDAGSLPAEYNDVPLSGMRTLNGQMCRTVGDLKAADLKDPTMGGWSG